MVEAGQVKLWDTLAFKILPLIFLIPLTLRVLDQTGDIPIIGNFLVDSLRFDIEAYFYAVIVFFIALVSLFEFSFARTTTYENFLTSLNAGAFLMLVAMVVGFVLGITILATGYPNNESVTIFNSTFNAEWLTQFVPYYMIVGIIILIASARQELQFGIRLGLRLKQN